MTDFTCYSCGRSNLNNNVLLTWFYTEEKLVKRPLCQRCANDNDSVDYYGAKDMYTADEVIRRLRHIRNQLLKELDNFDVEESSTLMRKADEVFKPTLEEDEIKLEK